MKLCKSNAEIIQTPKWLTMLKCLLIPPTFVDSGSGLVVHKSFYCGLYREIRILTLVSSRVHVITKLTNVHDTYDVRITY